MFERDLSRERHLRIDLLSPLNEPDWNGIEGPLVDAAQYVRLLHKLAVRLDALGLGAVKFVGPDVANPAPGGATGTRSSCPQRRSPQAITCG